MNATFSALIFTEPSNRYERTTVVAVDTSQSHWMRETCQNRYVQLQLQDPVHAMGPHSRDLSLFEYQYKRANMPLLLVGSRSHSLSYFDGLFGG